jgi:hypothetical protein
MHRLTSALVAVATIGGVLSTHVPVAQAATAISGSGTVYAGIYSSEWDASVDISNLAGWSGRRVTFLGTFHQPFESESPNWSGNTSHILEEAWEGQATPVANLSVNATAASIAAGQQDAAIRQWVRRVKSWTDLGGGRSLFIAPLQEHNGTWVPYGCDPVNFKSAFRRIRDIARNEGLGDTKVRWVWAPNGWTDNRGACAGTSLSDYYPGADVVDVIGYSAYRWSTESVYAVVGGIADTLRSFAAEKPYFVIQTAAWPSGSKDQWIRDLFSWASADPNVVGVVWFNLVKETDWRVWSSPSGPLLASGWADAVSSGGTGYQWPLTNWFQPGSLNFSPFPPVANVCPQGANCDTVLFQNTASNMALWHTVSSPRTESSFYFGNPGDVLFSGDWNCDGVETPGLYRRSDGYVYLRNSNSQGVADIKFFFGNPGDLPLAGDFNRDGCDTVSIYRPSTSQIFVMNRLGSNDGGLGAAEYSFYFGNPGDKPFVGDFNGDGIDTVGLHRESSGFLYFRNSNDQGPAHFQFYYGDPGDMLIAGDWNGDGVDTVAVYRPSAQTFYIRNSNSPGNADATLWAGSFSGLAAIDR